MKHNKKMIGNLKDILKFSFPSLMILISTPSYALQSNFTFVHSAWMGGWQWEYVTKELSTKGDFTFNTPDLPGHGKDKTSPTSIEFNDYVKSITNRLDEQSEPTILVGHSFGGMVASQVAQARPEKVKALVYLCAFMLPNGVSFMDATKGVQGSAVLDNLFFNDDKTAVGVRESELHQAVAHDVPAHLFKKTQPSMVMEPTAPLNYKLSLSDNKYGSIPRYYIKCSEDNAIPTTIQDAMIQELPVKKSFALKSSHVPVFSNPNGVANILSNIAIKEQSVGVNAVELRAAISANHRLFKSNVQQRKFEAFMEGASLSKIYRLYDNGSQVIAHFETTRDGKPSAEFILLNTKEGKPSSFWAAKQMVPENQVQNRTMFDGEINIDHTANTTKNKTIIEHWLNDVWIQGKSEQISRYFNNGKVIQHNPHVKDNVDGLYELAENNIHIHYTDIVDTFAIGDFVLTFSKGKMNEDSIWVADLFRLKNEKIAEHWDVIEFK